MAFIQSIIQSARNSAFQAYRNLRFAQSVHSAHVIFAKRYVEWAEFGFDRSFLRNQMHSLLHHVRDNSTDVTPQELANAWADQFEFSDDRRQRMVEKVAPIAADYLYLLQGEWQHYSTRFIGTVAQPAHTKSISMRLFNRKWADLQRMEVGV